MPRKWSRAAQIAHERPQEPLTAHCSLHRPRRTTIRLILAWVDGRPLLGPWWCLACSGCPRCGAHQLWEQIEEDDAGLFRDPIMLAGRPIRGDWWCLRCGDWLVQWCEYRRLLRRWRAGLAARAGGYRRGDEAA
jgi:hypothetical protein